jgi:hypothetical protein
MSAELTFLNEKPSAVAPVQVALFGKHPLAPDHLEDLGLASVSLAAFKRGFYVDGIGECLARQTWAKDLQDLETIPYDHVALCVGQSGWLIARLKQSVDAAGRRQFPLVLAVHGSGLAGLNRMPELEQLIESKLHAAVAARDLEELKQVHHQAQALALQITASAVPPPFMATRQSWLNSLPLGQDHEGLWRIGHALSPQGAGAGRARVPLHPAGLWISAVLWTSWCRCFLTDAGAPLITVLWKKGQGVADLALGPPNTRLLSTLFIADNALPLTSAIPFNVTPEVIAAGRLAVDAWLGQSELFAHSKGHAPSSLLNKVCNKWQGLFKS